MRTLVCIIAGVLVALPGSLSAQTVDQTRPGLWLSAPTRAPVTAEMAPAPVAPAQETVRRPTVQPTADVRPIPRPTPPSGFAARQAPDVALVVVTGVARPLGGAAQEAGFVSSSGDDAAVVLTPVPDTAAVAPVRPAPRVAVVPSPGVVPDLADAPQPTPRPLPQGAAVTPEPEVALEHDAAIADALEAASDPPAVQITVDLVPVEDAAPALPTEPVAAPMALDAAPALVVNAPRNLAAVLLPAAASQSVLPRRMRAVVMRAPLPDAFPISALPPSALPSGPEALDHARSLPVPQPEAMAAILMGPTHVRPGPIGVPAAPARPLTGTPPRDPNAPVALPAPDPMALARLVEEVEICWRYARLGPEARWAHLSVDVALDEMNQASAASIRLTGFSRVMSEAAGEAFDAVRTAMISCAYATDADPATAHARLRFSPDGVVLR